MISPKRFDIFPSDSGMLEELDAFRFLFFNKRSNCSSII